MKEVLLNVTTINWNRYKLNARDKTDTWNKTYNLEQVLCIKFYTCKRYFWTAYQKEMGLRCSSKSSPEVTTRLAENCLKNRAIEIKYLVFEQKRDQRKIVWQFHLISLSDLLVTDPTWIYWGCWWILGKVRNDYDDKNNDNDGKYKYKDDKRKYLRVGDHS